MGTWQCVPLVDQMTEAILACDNHVSDVAEPLGTTPHDPINATE